MIDKLEDLCEEAVDDGLTVNRATIGNIKPTDTVSLQLRINLV